MPALTTYRTGSSLLVSSYHVARQMAIFSPKKFSLEQKLERVEIREQVKLVVNDGALFVTYAYSSNQKEELVFHLVPSLAGMLALYVQPAMVKDIEDFLDAHFPGVATPELNELECDVKDEIRFPSGATDDQKEQIAALVARICSLAFPVYSTFISNRISDGYYVDRILERKRTKAQRSLNYKQFIIALFGVYRKDLAKAAAGSNAESLVWAANFTGILDTDSIVDALRNCKSFQIDETAFNMEPIRDFPRATLKHLLADGLNTSVDSLLLEDALNMAKRVPAAERKKCKSWRLLHDIGMLNNDVNIKRTDKVSHPAEFVDFFQKANFDDLKVSPLCDAKDFLETGREMNVCVGDMSYINRAYDGEGYCFRLENSKRQSQALVEIGRQDRSGVWLLRQAKGVNNAELPSDLVSKISNELSKFIQLESRL